MKPKIFRLEKRRIKVSEINTTPLFHRQISTELEERIRKFEPVFAELYPKTHSEWLEGFQAELDPENEVRIWEAMTCAYQSFLANYALSLPARKEAFCMLCSGQTVNPEMGCLSEAQKTELVRLYSEALAKSHKPFQPN